MARCGILFFQEVIELKKEIAKLTKREPKIKEVTKYGKYLFLKFNVFFFL